MMKLGDLIDKKTLAPAGLALAAFLGSWAHTGNVVEEVVQQRDAAYEKAESEIVRLQARMDSLRHVLERKTIRHSRPKPRGALQNLAAMIFPAPPPGWKPPEPPPIGGRPRSEFGG